MILSRTKHGRTIPVEVCDSIDARDSEGGLSANQPLQRKRERTAPLRQINEHAGTKAALNLGVLRMVSTDDGETILTSRGERHLDNRLPFRMSATVGRLK